MLANAKLNKQTSSNLEYNVYSTAEIVSGISSRIERLFDRYIWCIFKADSEVKIFEIAKRAEAVTPSVCSILEYFNSFAENILSTSADDDFENLPKS